MRTDVSVIHASVESSALDVPKMWHRLRSIVNSREVKVPLVLIDANAKVGNIISAADGINERGCFAVAFGHRRPPPDARTLVF